MLRSGSGWTWSEPLATAWMTGRPRPLTGPSSGRCITVGPSSPTGPSLRRVSDVSQLALAWTDPDWMRHAACVDMPLPETSSVEAAIAVCQSCSVRLPCLSFALERDEPYGVWGGLTYAERKAERRRQRSAADEPSSHR